MDITHVGCSIFSHHFCHLVAFIIINSTRLITSQTLVISILLHFHVGCALHVKLLESFINYTVSFVYEFTTLSFTCLSQNVCIILRLPYNPSHRWKQILTITLCAVISNSTLLIVRVHFIVLSTHSFLFTDAFT